MEQKAWILAWEKSMWKKKKCGPVQHTGPYFSWIGILKYSL